jgi:hypothetical protein
MVTHTGHDGASYDLTAQDDMAATKLAEMRDLLALRTRERDALQDERDALLQRMAALTEDYDAAITQWQRRCEASLDAQIELAATRFAQPQADDRAPHPGDAEHITMRLQADDRALRLADAEHAIAQKNTYILHLESLLAANPISLMGSWRMFRRQRRSLRS